MKTLFAILFIFFSINIQAQCDKNYKLVSNKSRTVQDAFTTPLLPSNISIEVKKKNIIITDGDTKYTTTIIQTIYCDWTKLLKDGTSRYKVENFEYDIIEVQSINGSTVFRFYNQNTENIKKEYLVKL